MKTLHRTYGFRMDPTAAQSQALARFAGARRFVWNWALARRKEHYATTGMGPTAAQQSKQLSVLKKQPETAWLAEVPRQSIEQALRDLDAAYTNFFAKTGRLPRFKSRKHDKARFRAYSNVYLTCDGVQVPKIGVISLRGWREPEGKFKTATFKQDAAGLWFVFAMFEFEMPDAALPPAGPASTIGIDVGLTDFAVLSDGMRVANPRFYRRAQVKLKRAQRAVCRRQKGSKRRAKAKRKVALIHRKTAYQRGDFLHKLTTGIVAKFQTICVEDLNVSALAKTKLHGHAKSWRDAAIGEFRRQLAYKCEWNRRHFVAVDRWFPSSKTCSDCGAVKAAMAIKERRWSCECGATHDRDLNAARNIKAEGLRMLAAGHAES